MNALAHSKLDFVHQLAMAPDFTSSGVCFAARQTGLYVSHDGGSTWRPCFSSLSGAALPATAVVLSPTFAEDGTVFAGTRGGVLRSRDGGIHWAFLALARGHMIVTALAVSPDFPRDGLALAGTLEDGVFRTVNGGDGWTGWNFGLHDLRAACLAFSPDFARDETIMLGTQSGLWRSGSGGRSWVSMPLPGEHDISAVACTGASDSSVNVWAGTEQGSIVRVGLHEGAASVARAGDEPIRLIAPPLLVHAAGITVTSGDAVNLFTSEQPIVCAACPPGTGHVLIALDDGRIERISISAPAAEAAGHA
jgi:photosystem II stability/assembly factor-like uncharacterized protein